MIRVLAHAIRTCRWTTVGALLSVLLSAAFGVGLVYLIGRVVGALPGALDPTASRAELLWLLLALLVVFAGNAVAPILGETFATRLEYLARERLFADVAAMMLAPGRIAHLDDSRVADQRRRALGHEGQAIAMGVRHAPAMFGARLSLLGACALVGWFFSWWIALFLLICGFGKARWMAYWFVREDEIWTGQAERHRRADYFFTIGTGEGVPESRVFGLRHWLVGRYGTEWVNAVTAYHGLRWRIWTVNTVVLTGHLLAHLVAIWLVVRAARAETVDLEALATVVPAIIQASTAAGAGGDGLVVRALPALRALRTLPSTIARCDPVPDVVHRPGAAEAASEPADRSVSGAEPASWTVGSRPGRIVFENVEFRYPGRSEPVLNDLRLCLEPGQTVGLVGLNGAGKSTLVRLLTGMLRPTAGRISCDGTDLASLDADRLAEWQQSFAIVDQRFLRLPLSRDENVFLGNNATRNDESGDLRLPHSGETVLGSASPDGTAEWVEPSGGEWQRIALARAKAAIERGADRLVLDEPAAALDVRAEAALVDHYLSLTKGRTVLLISHRLSVVRGADRICVLDDGRIVEDGSHDELMAVEGRYARMFRLQAERLIGNHETAGE